MARAVTPDFIRAYSKRGERPRCRLGPRSEHNGEMWGFTAKEDVGDRGPRDEWGGQNSGSNDLTGSR